MLVVFAVAFVAAAAIGLPVDYLRRHAAGTVALTVGLVNAMLVIAVVTALAGTSLVGGWGVPALVLGLIAGNAAADAAATHRWGPATKRSERCRPPPRTDQGRRIRC
jgi:H+/Cl- antiporter ClcA